MSVLLAGRELHSAIEFDGRVEDFVVQAGSGALVEEHPGSVVFDDVVAGLRRVGGSQAE